MTNNLYNELRPVGTQPSVLYGLGKVPNSEQYTKVTPNLVSCEHANL